ncbi:DUF5034 domain-containing protein [Dysgonomonas massiliensis]|uniref:DUF5034 domain-containing protein n=1 Tax=Dysgonomonas massiliensis TaxID=2040292 RepID=UPI000C7663C7|nr:DUF5034 domain-containing protein [Dysgonomonas massiliensis]
MKTRFTQIAIAIALLLGMTSCPGEDYNWRTKPVYLHQIEVQNIDMSGAEPVESNTSISMKAYAIALLYMVSDNPKTEGVSQDTRLKTLEESHKNQKFVSIEVFCNRDFNADYPAGSDIAKLFVRGILPTGRIDESDIAIDYLVMTTQPENPGKYQFRVCYNLEDEVLEATTLEVDLY